MATQAPPPSATRYHAASAAAAVAATRAASVAKPRGVRAIWNTVALYQVAQAQVAEEAVALMLAQQSIDREAEALLSSAAFTTAQRDLERMLEDVDTDWRFEQLVASLVQDAGRTAEGVAIAARADIGHVRMLNPPSCGRCVVLAGRVYRYSTGFLRHPGDDCVMIPTTLANQDYLQDPVELARDGLISNLSKADRRAILDGADPGQVINVRLQRSGLTESGRTLLRRGRLTPEAIYRNAATREDALTDLQAAGYIR